MSSVALTPGTTFANDYTVTALLAVGGMGTIYRAEQRSTGNAFALKLMLPELLVDARSRQRFEQEARMTARIGLNGPRGEATPPPARGVKGAAAW